MQANLLHAVKCTENLFGPRATGLPKIEPRDFDSLAEVAENAIYYVGGSFNEKSRSVLEVGLAHWFAECYSLANLVPYESPSDGFVGMAAELVRRLGAETIKAMRSECGGITGKINRLILTKHTDLSGWPLESLCQSSFYLWKRQEQQDERKRR